MKIIKESPTHLVVSDNSYPAACVAAAFSLIGVAFIYQVATGQSDDYFAALFCLAFPVTGALALVREKTTTFSNLDNTVTIRSKALIRPAEPIQLNFVRIKEAVVILPRGGVAGDAHMGAKIVLTCAHKNVSISATGSRLPGPVKTREILDKINALLIDA